MTPIPNYPDYFFHNGEIYSKRKYRGNPTGKLRKLNPTINKDGRYIISLYGVNGKKVFRMDRIIELMEERVCQH